uniref:threonine/serine exporter family protein n=1 Tax=Ndongobacter massiliensis TaxID=1871025 RepID=UPI0009315431|nr:threonine/serine exporter family protein [Ndongobacter massiliensis]
MACNGFSFWLTVLGAGVATSACALILGLRQKMPVFYVFFAGAAGWGIQSAMIHRFGDSSAILLVATVLATAGVSVFTQVGARLFRTPVTVLLIPSLFPIVPGALLYRMAFAFFVGDVQTASTCGIQALLTSGGIALGILSIESFVLGGRILRGRFGRRQMR